MLKMILLSACALAGTAQMAAAATTTLDRVDHAYLATDPGSAAGPFGAVSAYGEAFGLGCTDSRYCEIGSFSVSTRDGWTSLRLDTQLLNLTAPVTDVRYGGTQVVVSAKTLLEIFDPAIDFTTYTGTTPPPTLTVTKIKLTFANLTDNQSVAFGDPFSGSTATALVQYVTAVPAPASGLLAISALLLFVRRRRSAAA